jgi:hypothetical protein
VRWIALSLQRERAVRERIIEEYAERYVLGVCLAIRDIWGDEKFIEKFGGETAEEAMRNCMEAGRDNARRYVEKWLIAWPEAMARVFLEQ